MIYVLKEERITPACAGSTKARSEYSILSEDHPRLRGEYCNAYHVNDLNEGSPPLARGVLISSESERLSSRITPACAGSTGSNYVDTELKLGSPPLARGVPIQKIIDNCFSGITPACAGSTLFV